jgi:hypothetical protein
MKNMHGKFLGFGRMQQNIFFFLKMFLIFFWNISEKNRYFNTEFVFYNVNIQPDIMQNG